MKSSEIYCSVQMKSGKFSNICLHLMLLRRLTRCLDCTVTCDSSRLLFPLCPLPELPCGGPFAHHIWTLLCSVSAAQCCSWAALLLAIAESQTRLCISIVKMSERVLKHSA